MNRESQIIDLFQNHIRYRNDDCGDIPETNQIVTTDSMAEGTHFKRETAGPEDLAHKLVHSNLSDMASGGGSPSWATLNFGIPADTSLEFCQRFARTLREELDRVGCTLVGGDTFRSPFFNFHLTVGGPVLHRRLLRGAGKAGDQIFLTGDTGLSLAGLLSLEGHLDLSSDPELEKRAIDKHLRPVARLPWARSLALQDSVHGVMDLSDGLLLDLEKMAYATDLRFVLELDRIPVDPELLPFLDRRQAARSGEEYELIFTAPGSLPFDFPVTPIGRLEPGPAGLTVMENGQILDRKSLENGFDHFQPEGDGK